MCRSMASERNGTLADLRARWAALRYRWHTRRSVRVIEGLGHGSVHDLHDARGAMRTILTRNLLPFWRSRIASCGGPGYPLNHDVRGRFLGPGRLRLVSQARVLWAFSRLANTRWNDPLDRGRAERGFGLLTGPMRDELHGGVFWELDPLARYPTMPVKCLYGHAFALFALSTFAQVERSAHAEAAAREVFDVMEDRFRDREYGGYVETLQRDWRRVPGGRAGCLGAPPDVKLSNSHLHVLEALTAYLSLTGAPQARARVAELADILLDSAQRSPVPHFSEQYTREWKPVDAPSARRVSYGHDLETVMLLISAFRALQRDDRRHHGLYCDIADAALRFGEDALRGGFFSGGRVAAAADHRDKLAWVQAEALLALGELHRLLGDSAHADAMLRTLNWILGWQCDWEHGEWFERIDHRNRASGLKAGPWGGPYHALRAMIECLDMSREV